MCMDPGPDSNFLGTISSIQSTVRWRSDHRQMALRSVPTSNLCGTPGQTKVSGDRQRETTHEVCCLAAKLAKSLLSCIYCDRNSVTTFLKTKSFMCIAVRS